MSDTAYTIDAALAWGTLMVQSDSGLMFTMTEDGDIGVWRAHMLGDPCLARGDSIEDALDEAHRRYHQVVAGPCCCEKLLDDGDELTDLGYRQ